MSINAEGGDGAIEYAQSKLPLEKGREYIVSFSVNDKIQLSTSYIDRNGNHQQILIGEIRAAKDESGQPVSNIEFLWDGREDIKIPISPNVDIGRLMLDGNPLTLHGMVIPSPIISRNHLRIESVQIADDEIIMHVKDQSTHGSILEGAFIAQLAPYKDDILGLKKNE